MIAGIWRRLIFRIASYLGVWIIIATASFLLPAFSNVDGSPDSKADSYSLLARAVTGEIVFGDSANALDMPDAEIRSGSNTEFVKYVIEHPVANLRLAAAKVGWELAQVRPWYSDGLNLYLAVFTVTFYGLIVLAFLKYRGSPLFPMFAALSLPLVCFIGLTWSIWEGRFAWWFLPIWTVIVGGGAQAAIAAILRSPLYRKAL
jgi:hypothetical protein